MTDIHDPSGIQSRNPSKRAAVDPRLRPLGHWDRIGCLLFENFKVEGQYKKLDHKLEFQENWSLENHLLSKKINGFYIRNLHTS
jgi:hypothetical protein